MIVITGATGHIGNVLTRELLAKGKKVRTVIPPFEDISPLKRLDVEKVEGDVRDINSLIQAFKGAEIVYHLAGIVSILPGKKELLYQINVKGTANVVEACLKSEVQRLVYTSSIHAIAEPPHGVVINETFPFDPDMTLGEYSKSKALATQEVFKGVERGLDAVIVCPTGVIGPHDYKISEMGKLIIDFIQKRLKAYIEGAYDFVDVRDVAIGHILAAEEGKSGESYILSGEQITVNNLLQILEEISDVRAPSFKIPVELARVIAAITFPYYSLTKTKPLFTSYSIDVLTSNSLVSCEKARQELGFSSRSIRESIVDALQWFKENDRL